MNRMRIRADYESDVAAWATAQASAAREGRLSDLDLPHIAEELEGLANSDRTEIRRRLRVLLMHLLKHRYQPAKRKRSWLTTIREQRRAIDDVIDHSPSLASHPAKILARVYPQSRSDAAFETGLPGKTFPKECPFSLAQILDTDWLPGD